MTSLTKIQEEKLAELRKIFRGKVLLVSSGGPITAEAQKLQDDSNFKEHSRRNEGARRSKDHFLHSNGTNDLFKETCIRASDASEEPLLLTKPNLPAGAPEESRNFLSFWEDRAQVTRAQQIENAKSILLDQLRRMATPRGNWPKRTAPVPPETEELVSQSATDDSDSLRSSEKGFKSPQNVPRAKKSPKNNSQTVDNDEEDEDRIPVWAKGAELLPDPDEEEVVDSRNMGGPEDRIPAWARGADDLPDMESPERKDVDRGSQDVDNFEGKQGWNGKMTDLRSHVLKMRKRIMKTQHKQIKHKKKRKRGNQQGDSVENKVADSNVDYRNHSPSEVDVNKDEATAGDAMSLSARKNKRKSESPIRKRGHRDDSVQSSNAPAEPNDKSEHNRSGTAVSRSGRTIRPPGMASTSASVDSSIHTVDTDTVTSVGTGSALMRGRKPSGPRKCHHCKLMQNDTVKCQYIMLTGNRCGKHYCIDCISKEYLPTFDPRKAEQWQ